MTSYDFAISGQHYLFDVQSFAHTILAAGGDAFSYALLDRTTQGVIDDVASGAAELGVIMQTSETESALNEALAEAGLAFHELAVSAPLVALPSSHPFVNAKSPHLGAAGRLSPYVYFDQGEDAPIGPLRGALPQVPRAKKVACTDRASLTELIMAING
ncbi:MAG: LysR family transcriptional regulator [Adlercreutzia equolifaciens]